MKFFYRFTSTDVEELPEEVVIEFASFPNEFCFQLEGLDDDGREFLELCILSNIEDGVPITVHDSPPAGYPLFVEITEKDARLIQLYNYHCKSDRVDYQHIATNLVYGLFSTGSELSDWLDMAENELHPISIFVRKDFHKVLGSIDTFKDKTYYNVHNELIADSFDDSSTFAYEFLFYHGVTDTLVHSVVLIPDDVPAISEKVMVDIIAPIVTELLGAKMTLLEGVPLIELSLLRYQVHAIADSANMVMDISRAKERDLISLLKRIDEAIGVFDV